MKLHDFQKMLRDDGWNPRKINDAAREQHRANLDAEIAAGKWRCPVCHAPMRRRPGTAIMYCDKEH
jgi:hypothetical protein